ncbi:hypothetical protein [Arthrobacter sp. ISL-72]|uniref:hypothetical protein n=1 Tax=Arthrobacter sp. ISL-72 TaxID=2819114 RepID=UPI0037C0513A
MQNDRDELRLRHGRWAFGWCLQWGGVIFVGAVAVGGALLYRLRIRHHTGIPAEHAAAVAGHPSSGPPEQPQPAENPVRAEADRDTDQGLEPLEEDFEP